MDLYLTAGFGEPLGTSNLDLISSLGFVGIKQDAPSPALHEILFEEIHSRPGFKVIWLVKPAQLNQLPAMVESTRRRNLTSRTAFEVIGEPDLGDQTTPGDHATLMWQLQELHPDMTWILGGVSGCHERGFNFLSATMEVGIPRETIVSVHPYRTTRKPDDPFYYRTRAEEFARLRELAGDRRIWATECGWHTAPHMYTTCFFVQRRRTWTEEQVAQFTTRELELQRMYGTEAFTWFQFNDGPLPDYHEHHYGIRRMDLSLKPVAAVFSSQASAVSQSL